MGLCLQKVGGWVREGVWVWVGVGVQGRERERERGSRWWTAFLDALPQVDRECMCWKCVCVCEIERVRERERERVIGR